MAQVTIYGASDDLAEIDGDFYDEFDADIYARGTWLFSTGTRIDMYSDDDGSWVLENVTPEGVVNTDEIVFGPRPDRPAGTRDMACTVTGDFTEVIWIKNAPRSARRTPIASKKIV